MIKVCATHLNRYLFFASFFAFLNLSANQSQAQCVALSNNFWLVNTAAAGSPNPAGQSMVTTNTGTPNGFTPTAVLSGTPMVWYSAPISGLYNSGTYTFSLWTNSPGATSNVTVQLGYSNQNGSGSVLLGTSTGDVNLSGAGNHITNFTFNVPVLNFTNKVFWISITQANGTDATIVYNDGTDFGTVLNTTIGQSPACPTWTPTPCGYTSQIETDGTSDKVLYDASQATADPGGWTAPGFNAGANGFTNAAIWTSPTGPGIAGVPWASWSAGGPGNGADKELVIHALTIPAGAINISGTLNLAVDDNSTSYMNGSVIQSDSPESTFITNQTVRTFSIPGGSLVPGNNVLAIENGDSVPVFIGYNFQLVIYYTIPCITPTNTPTSTPTSTVTNTKTATPTSTFTNTFTNTPTKTFTSTFTLTFTNTNSSTPTNTATQTFTNTLTDTPTHTNTPTNTFTPTFTNTLMNSPTPTNTPTNTFSPTNTNTPTDTPTRTNTPTNTFTPTFTNTLINSPTSTNTSTNTFTTTNTNTPTFTNTLINSATPTNTPTNTFTRTNTPTFTATNTFTKTVTNTDTPTKTNTPTPTFTPTVTPTYTWTFTPTPIGQFAVSVNVYNSAGEVVKTILVRHFAQPINNISLPSNMITTLNGPGSTIQIYYQGVLMGTWDGSNNSGSPVSNGTYQIQVDNANPAGVVTSVSQQVMVNRKLSDATVNIFNSAGEVVKKLYQVVADSTNSEMTSVDLSTNILHPSTSTLLGQLNSVQILVMTSSSTAVTLSWNGTNDLGSVVTPGQYEIEVHWDGGQGGLLDITRDILVTAGSGSGAVIARPNLLAVNKGITTTTFDGSSIPNAASLKVTLYTVAGQLVTVVSGSSGTALAAWNASGVASGIYIATVEVVDMNGNIIRQQRLKVLVIH